MLARFSSAHYSRPTSSNQRDVSPDVRWSRVVLDIRVFLEPLERLAKLASETAQNHMNRRVATANAARECAAARDVLSMLDLSSLTRNGIQVVPPNRRSTAPPYRI